jgi:GST-like protein
MIDLYTWATPNGYKISIMLEEVGLPYGVKPVNLEGQEQLTPEFTAVNPNQKIPAIVDHDGLGAPLTLFESGAILFYLAEKTGRLLPTTEPARSRTMQWLMFQMGNVGPMIGQAGHFINDAPEKIDYAITRYVDESLRIVRVLNTALADSEYVAGDYSIADVASYPWIHAAWEPFKAMMGEKVAEVANVQRWLDAIAARPAVVKGMAVPKID